MKQREETIQALLREIEPLKETLDLQ